MTIKHSVVLRLISIQVFLGAGTASAAITFVPGHYYTSYYDVAPTPTITQFNTTRNVVGSITVPFGLEVRGLTFGPDNLLYVTTRSGHTGFSVVAMDSAGVAHQTYSANVPISGNTSYGKSAIGGQYLYVAGANVLTRFLLGDPSSGTTIYINTNTLSVFDVKPLPSGNLLVASQHEIKEITNAGSVIRTISLVNPNGDFFSNIRGIEYSAATNDLFVTMSGYSGFTDKLLRLDATTGVLEREATFSYCDDLFLTASGDLLVGSRTFTPSFYDQNLNYRAALPGNPQQFVTQFVPEPSIVGLLGAAGGTLLLRRRR